MATSVHLGYPGAVGGAAVGAARSPKQASRVRRHDETDFMQSLFDALTKCGILVWRNNTGVAKWDNGARTRYGIGKGGADLVGCVGGAFFGIETKAKTGQSPAQVAWQRAVEQAGGLYILARTGDTVAEVVERVLAWGRAWGRTP